MKFCDLVIVVKQRTEGRLANSRSMLYFSIDVAISAVDVRADVASCKSSPLCTFFLIAVSGGDFGTIRDFEIIFSVFRVECNKFYIRPGALRRCLHRAKTLPAHRQISFAVCVK